jgi:hypothetical protein
MNEIGLFALQHPLEGAPGTRIACRWGVATIPLREERPQMSKGALDSVHPDAVHLLERRKAILPQRGNRDSVPASHESRAQVLDYPFLAADDRSVELGDHQDAH